MRSINTNPSSSKLTLSCIAIALIILTQVLAPCFAHQLTKPPTRPSSFKNKAELTEYLRRLNAYYDVVGRPRFGKRAMGPSEYGGGLDDAVNNVRSSVIDLLDFNGDGKLSSAELGLAYYLDEIAPQKKRR
ncbi:uncharacterized protein LOC106166893 [Lingula anatina]|uniref:Uncharacterized protein LOC106166893 n=1 Tax=Lingula anatina TaxID=7574 RepID=A0A1S3IS33_LINAN|nr:uncharacterized protein LOC106166893 [Lingula anatina]XP_013401020.1 uncharacterized protein LOC106166893 [Lingula anatina]|eukprot:XP_013401012.1 uncharacterized protein LOC106166893 [Lingula anatina]